MEFILNIFLVLVVNVNAQQTDHCVNKEHIKICSSLLNAEQIENSLNEQMIYENNHKISFIQNNEQSQKISNECLESAHLDSILPELSFSICVHNPLLSYDKITKYWLQKKSFTSVFSTNINNEPHTQEVKYDFVDHGKIGYFKVSKVDYNTYQCFVQLLNKNLIHICFEPFEFGIDNLDQYENNVSSTLSSYSFFEQNSAIDAIQSTTISKVINQPWYIRFWQWVTHWF